MCTSKQGVEFIRSHEGFSNISYRGQDVQNLTVGYGHVITAEDGHKYDNGITKEQAEIQLQQDIIKAEKYVNSFIDDYGIELTQNEYDALISFTFNVGCGWLIDERTSDLKNMLISGDYTEEDITNELLTWTNAGGGKSPGLVDRRTDEAELFNEAKY